MDIFYIFLEKARAMIRETLISSIGYGGVFQSNGKYYVNILCKGRTYTLPLNVTRGRHPVELATTYDEGDDGCDVTELVLRYYGPDKFRPFDGRAVCPGDMGLDNLQIFSRGEVLEFGKEQPINI